MSAPGAIVLGTHIAALSAGWRALESERALNVALDEAVALRYELAVIPLIDPQVTYSTLATRPKTRALRTWFHISLPARCHLPARPELARHWLGKALDSAEATGANFLCGALGWSAGILSEPDRVEEERVLIVEVLRDLAQDAQRRGVHLALEPANRYETSLCNTLADGVALVEAIAMPNLYLLANTKHMHIEEASLSDALHASREHLCALYLAENTGGKLGTGAVSWTDCWQTLSEIKFDGALIVTPYRTGASTGATKAERCAAAQSLPFLRTAVRAIQSPPPPVKVDSLASSTFTDTDKSAEKKTPPLRKHPNTKSYRRRG